MPVLTELAPCGDLRSQGQHIAARLVTIVASLLCSLGRNDEMPKEVQMEGTRALLMHAVPAAIKHFT